MMHVASGTRRGAALQKACASFAAAVGTRAVAAADHAAPAAAAYSPTGNVLQMLAGLALVLFIMWACTWALRRYAAGRSAAGSALRVLGGVAVGQRERVVMVEVDDTWILVGVAPGRVNALHVMSKLPDMAPRPAAPDAAEGFAARLARFMPRNGREQ